MRTVRIYTLICLLSLAGFLSQRVTLGQNENSCHYSIIESGNEWQLLREGKPFYIKGAVGWAHFDVLKSCGGNAVRARASKRNLDRAWEYKLLVMAGLPVRGERDGMDWGDQVWSPSKNEEFLR